jgi:putative oxidoreductase
LQRLFSTFPEGWPGAGLVFSRAAAAILLMRDGLTGLPDALSALVILQLISAGAAALLLVGLLTPFAGGLIAVSELCLAYSHVSDLPIHISLGLLGIALAMLGPGAWSVDARLFGRKRIRITSRDS